MSLEHKLSGIWDDIELREESGALVLHSERLEEIQRPIQESTIPYLGKAINFLKRVVRSPWERNLQRYFSQGLEDHLEEQIEHGDEANRENYTNLLTAFRDYHNVHINHLKVNHQDKTMPGILKRWSMLWGFLAVESFELITSFDYDLSIAEEIGVATIGFAFVSYVSRQRDRQRLPTVSLDLDEIKEDILHLSTLHEKAFDRSLGRNNGGFGEEEIVRVLDALNAGLITDEEYVICSSDIREKYKSVRETWRKKKEHTPERITELKKQADVVLQKYCPSKDLDGLDIKLKKLWGAQGKTRMNGTKITIDDSELKWNVMEFVATYGHEVAHTDGVRVEGMAHYTMVKMLIDLEKVDLDGGHEYKAYDILLDAAVCAYGLERKKQVHGKLEPFYYAKDVLVYQARNLFRKLTRQHPFHSENFALERQIHEELKEAGAKSACFSDCFNLGDIFQSGIRKIYLGGWLFRGNYTKGLYLIAKDRGRFLPPPKNKPNSTE